jgi:lysine-ketoglutarate reductase/saccharopine dehydrogenase-like protein (TIGR00300 family)
MKDKILMCSPTFFDVNYVINPWMEGNLSKAKKDSAKLQWQNLYNIISKLADVVLIDPIDSLPDLVFTANAGLTFDNKFILSRFFYDERKGEEEIFEKYFKDNKFEILYLPEEVPFEGAGDALFDRELDILWAGYGFRTELAAHSYLNEMVPSEVVSLRLVDPRFYHLDTCFCPLNGGYLLYYPNAFDEYSNRLIKLKIPQEKLIPISEEDSNHFSCNSVNIGKNIILNNASLELSNKLEELGFTLIKTELTEFLKAGGAAKCLTIKLNEPITPSSQKADPIESQVINFEGHLIDSGIMGAALDTIINSGGSFQVLSFKLGEKRQSTSKAEIKILAPSNDILEKILSQLVEIGGTLPSNEFRNASTELVEKDGVAPDDFYVSTIFPTEVQIDGEWVRLQKQRMDGTIVIDHLNSKTTATCTLLRDLKKGQKVVTGIQGVRTLHKVRAREPRQVQEFTFMGASVSSERKVEIAVEQVAWDLRQARDRGGRIVVSAGPVVVHTGGSAHLSWLIREGYISALLGGNAIAVHDIENALLGTSLGVDLSRGIPVQGGHKHHLKIINTIRKYGSIENAVKEGVLESGLMYECIKHNVPFCLAGSIRDDGPLPDTYMDLIQAQDKYAELLKGAEIILLLSSMLHSIGVGNMTPSGVKMVCIDINPAVVTKLSDRGSVESLGIVTDVGLFLGLLVEKLKKLS